MKKKKKDKENTKAVVEVTKGPTWKPDPAWVFPKPETDFRFDPSGSHYNQLEQYNRGKMFQDEYYLSPIADEIGGLHKAVESLKESLRVKNEKCAVLQTSLDMLNHAVVVDEAKYQSAEKVANWAVTKLLIESIQKTDKIERLERKVKEFKSPKAKSHVADRLLNIIEKKDHMIRHLMKRLEKE